MKFNNSNNLKQEVNSEKDEFTSSPFKDIVLSKFQDKRQEQLGKINDARMLYENSPYSEDFETLDNSIDDIEEDIYCCMQIKDIARKYGVRNIVLGLWIIGSVHIDRIRRAYLLSADMQMDMSVEVLKDAIKDPNLKMEQAGLYRELSLSYSRQAGFKNQSKFGKKPSELDMTKPVLQVSDEQMDKMIEEMRKLKLAESSHNYIHFENVETETVNSVSRVSSDGRGSSEDSISIVSKENTASNERSLDSELTQEQQIQNVINSAKNNSSYDNDEFDLSNL